MNLFSFLPLMGAPDSGSGAAGAPGITNFIFPIALVAIFYFFVIRPQSRKQKETQKMLSAIKKGDKVVTIGGIHGVVQAVKENSNTVVIKVDEDTKIEFSRNAVSSVNPVKTDKGEEKQPEGNGASEESK
jgi:preprotein translocase subunit YajC